MVKNNYVIAIQEGTTFKEFKELLEVIPKECEDFTFTCCGMSECYLHIRPNDYNGNKCVTIDTEKNID